MSFEMAPKSDEIMESPGLGGETEGVPPAS